VVVIGLGFSVTADERADEHGQARAQDQLLEHNKSPFPAQLPDERVISRKRTEAERRKSD
jgi:hypothetical protein